MFEAKDFGKEKIIEVSKNEKTETKLEQNNRGSNKWKYISCRIIGALGLFSCLFLVSFMFIHGALKSDDLKQYPNLVGVNVNEAINKLRAEEFLDYSFMSRTSPDSIGVNVAFLKPANEESNAASSKDYIVCSQSINADSIVELGTKSHLIITTKDCSSIDPNAKLSKIIFSGPGHGKL